MVNDGGTETLEPVLKPFRDRLDIVLVEQSRRGPAAARNAGAIGAHGQYLAFTDDDCMVDAGWLSHLHARLLEESPTAMVGGRTINALQRNAFSTASQELISHLYDWYGSSSNSFVASNNVAVSAEVFRRIGGFDEAFPRAAGEDRELCDRWRHHGYAIVIASEPVVYHSHDLTLPRFLRQHFAYGRGAYHYHRIRSERRSERLRVEPLRFYTTLLAYPMSRGNGPRALSHMALLALSQLANAAGYAWEVLSGHRQPAARVPAGR